MTTRHLGNAGEDMAVAYLTTLGWTILERNYTCRYGELDIVALPDDQRADVLAFIEVKYRARTFFGTGLEAVTVAKQRKVSLAATHWMSERRKQLDAAGAHRPHVRFDVMDIGPAGVRDHVMGAW